jgi:hypothetical protein
MLLDGPWEGTGSISATFADKQMGAGASSLDRARLRLLHGWHHQAKGKDKGSLPIPWPSLLLHWQPLLHNELWIR